MIKDIIKKIVQNSGYDIRKKNSFDTPPEFPSDFTENDIEIIKKVKPFTLTSNERIYSLLQATKYVTDNDIPGDFVECGVWKGGSMMSVAYTLLKEKKQDRDLYLFDTYEGMSKPTELDVSFEGKKADSQFEENKRDENSSDWCFASINEVKQNVLETGYSSEKLHFVKGKVEDTLPENAPKQIALLRLDTDWYESTKHELIHLFPKLVSGGVLILDDYGYWAGAKKAVDEYISQNKIQILLNRIDQTGRIGIKI
jgi:copper chaperone CopZ